MSSEWVSMPQKITPVREFETIAELWLVGKSTVSFSNVRKLQSSQQRKRNNDKHDQPAQRSSIVDNSSRRLREKSSWLAMSKVTSLNDGQWIRVRCNLTEVNEKECRLTIIGDKETLQHSLNVRLLRIVDMRLTDRSLFFRNDCLSIHAPQSAFMPHSPSLQNLVSSEHVDRRRKNSKSYSTGSLLEPIYLFFDSRDAVNCWLALLRSYALPEIYGCEKASGGLFRLWRQVALTVMHARNLGFNKKLAFIETNISVQPPDVDRSETPSDASADSQLFCEIYYDNIIMGRTIYQKGQSGGDTDLTIWTWWETFHLSDLPPFGVLDVRIFRFRKTVKPTLIGHVEICLSHFKRGQLAEGWFPVMTVVNGRTGVQIGDLRMKINVDEEVILPSEAYSGITTMLDQHNCLDLLGELDRRIPLRGDMVSLAVGRSTFANDILDLAEREVQNAPSANTLFRGNSVFTKTVEQAMSFFGRSFLEASVGPSIMDLCSERVELETDPSRNTRGPKDVEQSVRQLQVCCVKFWMNIYNARDQCPSELRRLFHFIRELVERRFASDEDSANLKWQSVSAFCFLRLIVPAILHPHLWGLHPGLPTPPLQRSLTLIAKALQSLANLSTEKKELHMQGVSNFLEQNRQMMIDYINQISSPTLERAHLHVSDKYDRLSIIHSLRYLRENTKTTMPLFSESIPTFPYFLDVPKHLAVLSSAVIRQAGSGYTSLNQTPSVGQETLVEEFASKCSEVESRITQSVDILTSYYTHSQIGQSASSQRSSSLSSPDDHDIRFPHTLSEEDLRTNGSSDKKASVSPRIRSSSSKRPSTAPATSSEVPLHSPLPAPVMASYSSRSASPPNFPTSPMFQNPSRPTTMGRSCLATPVVSGSETTTFAALRRTMSQQLNLQEIESVEDIAKRRKRFLPAFFTRAQKHLQ